VICAIHTTLQIGANTYISLNAGLIVRACSNTERNFVALLFIMTRPPKLNVLSLCLRKDFPIRITIIKTLLFAATLIPLNGHCRHLKNELCLENLAGYSQSAKRIAPKNPTELEHLPLTTTRFITYQWCYRSRRIFPTITPYQCPLTEMMVDDPEFVASR
jgi:hypothetical protein